MIRNAGHETKAGIIFCSSDGNGWRSHALKKAKEEGRTLSLYLRERSEPEATPGTHTESRRPDSGLGVSTSTGKLSAIAGPPRRTFSPRRLVPVVAVTPAPAMVITVIASTNPDGANEGRRREGLIDRRWRRWVIRRRWRRWGGGRTGAGVGSIDHRRPAGTEQNKGGADKRGNTYRHIAKTDETRGSFTCFAKPLEIRTVARWV
jgi:hypothetical protein